jgi:hypothetical protein
MVAHLLHLGRSHFVHVHMSCQSDACQPDNLALRYLANVPARTLLRVSPSTCLLHELPLLHLGHDCRESGEVGRWSLP